MADIFRAVQQAAILGEHEVRWDPEEFLHPKQAEVFNCKEPYRCQRVGRRGGKSWGWAANLIQAGFDHPGSTPLYITTTRQDARDIMDPAFQAINEKYKLGLVQNKATGDISMPNGSKILMRGASTLREINKIRGPGYPCAVVDEIQNFGPDVIYLIDEVIEPALAQYHGWVGVSGTPPPAQYGPFWDIDQGKFSEAWEHFYWTFTDNPYIPDPEGFLERVLKRRGWGRDHPGFQREYMGLWIRDDQARAFLLDIERDTVPRFDKTHAWDFNYVMGIDIGYDDPTAYVVMAYSAGLGQAFVIDSFEQSEMTATEALTEAERFCQEYPITQIAIDASGGGSKMILKDWQKLTTLPVVAAKKTHKASQVSVINGDFQSGKIKIAKERCKKLINDLMVLEWDSEKKVHNKYVYPRGAPDHLPDAFQYCYNLCHHHHHDLQRDMTVKYGSPEYWEREERKMEEAQIAMCEAQDEAGLSPWEILERTLV